MNIPIPNKIEVKSSPIHGLGVFAKERILKDEIIEVCYAIFFKNNLGYDNEDILLKYRFSYPCNYSITKYAIPLGYGSIYNHSDNNNAFWTCDTSNALYYFISNRDIEIGEEICTSYGDKNYWEVIKKIN
jgi:SET domain-containing protein